MTKKESEKPPRSRERSKERSSQSHDSKNRPSRRPNRRDGVDRDEEKPRGKKPYKTRDQSDDKTPRKPRRFKTDHDGGHKPNARGGARRQRDPSIRDNIPKSYLIAEAMEEMGGEAKKADIARHFGIRGNDRIGLKKRLREMVAHGELVSGPRNVLRLPSFLPPVGVIITTEYDVSEAQMHAVPEQWEQASRMPRILISADQEKRHGSAVTQPKQRLLAKMERVDKGLYHANVIKVLGPADDSGAAEDVVGYVQVDKLDAEFMDGGNDGQSQGGRARIRPAHRKDKTKLMLPGHALAGARNGDLVRVSSNAEGRFEVTEVLARADDAGIISLATIHAHDIPHTFPNSVTKACDGLTVPEPSKKRQDIRDLPLVTIDGADARDFDDAVYAEPITSGKHKGGWRIVVAIADVSFYVTPGGALDQEAYKRGNSVYFPDRVVPMLPEALSNDLCSLRPHEDRAAMVADMVIDSNGQLQTQKVYRGLVHSAARLTYDQVQLALDGGVDEVTKPIRDTVIENLFQAYQILLRARQGRGTVDFDLPETQSIIEDGKVTAIVKRERHDSHKLIEEMMILANVAVARVLLEAEQPTIYRTHDRPDASRLEATKTMLHELGLEMGKTAYGVVSQQFQALLESVYVDSPMRPLVHEMVLRTMAQAQYHPDNIGHFGLALDHYAHFTSPIRRYADLIVHRSLVTLLGLDEPAKQDGQKTGLTEIDQDKLHEIAQHISNTERVAQSAERDATARYITTYYCDRIGERATGSISGVARAGIFVRLDDTQAEGLVPMRMMKDDFYEHDETRHCLIGRRSGRVIHMAMKVTIEIAEVDELAGMMAFNLIEIDEDSAVIPSPKKRSGRDGRGRDNRGGGGYRRSGDKRQSRGGGRGAGSSSYKGDSNRKPRGDRARDDRASGDKKSSTRRSDKPRGKASHDRSGDKSGKHFGQSDRKQSGKSGGKPDRGRSGKPSGDRRPSPQNKRPPKK